jgi:hypothetical protein
VGDAFLADFNSAVNAVRCAISIQKHLHDYNLDFTRSRGKNRQVRIGIHIGDVVMTNNDIFGDGVNIAARLQPIAEPGGICVSQDVYNHIKNQIEFHATSLGPHELKNIAQKIEIYKIVTEVMGGGIPSIHRPISGPVLGAHPTEPHRPLGPRFSIALVLVAILLGALAAFAWYTFAPKPVVFKSRYGFNAFFMSRQEEMHIDPCSSPGNQIERIKRGGLLVYHYDTGTAGCGVTFYPVNEPFAGGKYAVVEGCDLVQLHASAPQGLPFQIAINEAGVGAPGALSYPGVNGADGEQYLSPVITGSGRWQIYQIKLSDFTLSNVWGNQNGNKTLDLKGVDSLELNLPGNQGKGDFSIMSIVFMKSVHPDVVHIKR